MLVGPVPRRARPFPTASHSIHGLTALNLKDGVMDFRLRRQTLLASGVLWLACSAPNGSTDGPPGGVGGSSQPPTTGGATSGGQGQVASGGAQPTSGGPSAGGFTSGGSSNGGSFNGGASGSFNGGSNPGGASGMGGHVSGGSSNGGSGPSSGGSSKGGSGGSSTGGNNNKGGSSSGGSGKGGSSSGGASSGGASSGGSSSGGSGPTSCNLTGSPNPGSASFTWYHFSQGTYRDPQTNKYQTACGYLGTASGTTDTVENSSTPTYFVAIPGKNSTNFENNKYCGACVQLSNGGNSVIATVIDECPLDSNPLCVTGHLDVSKTAFDRLGFPVGNPKNTTWKFVPCPVMGNVKIRMKPGNPNEIYIENIVLALQSVSMNGQMGRRQSYGAWHWDGNIPQGATLNLTDVAGRSISVNVNSLTAGQNQDTGKQFPACN